MFGVGLKVINVNTKVEYAFQWLQVRHGPNWDFMKTNTNLYWSDCIIGWID